MNEHSLKWESPPKQPKTNMGLILYLFTVHFVLVSNILYLVVLHKSILPEALRGGIAEPLVRAAHGFAYAVFLAFCSHGTTPQNRFSRAKTGMKIGIGAAFSLLLLSLLSPDALATDSTGPGMPPLLYYSFLIIGGFGDAMTTPALLGIIASTEGSKGPKYVGYFWTSVSASYVYIPLLSGWFLSLAGQMNVLDILPFTFEFILSLLALFLFPIAYGCIKKSGPIPENYNSKMIDTKPTSILDLLRTLKAYKIILACVLILAANQFAFNSIKTASQEFAKPWNQLGLTLNAIMFFTASFLITRWWSNEKATKEKIRTWVLLSLGIILAVVSSVIVLHSYPALGVGTMLIFGPFSAFLYTGVNIYYAQFVIVQGEGNLGARLGMFSSLYRSLGSVGYLATALIMLIHGLSKFPIPFLAFIINGLPILLAAVLFALYTKK